MEEWVNVLLKKKDRLQNADGHGRIGFWLRAFMFLQEFAAFAGRIHTEDNNHGQENYRWQNGFHLISISLCRYHTTISLSMT